MQFNSTEGIKLGTNYKSIYKDFVTQTTTDISILIKKWKNSGALQKLLEMDGKNVLEVQKLYELSEHKRGVPPSP